MGLGGSNSDIDNVGAAGLTLIIVPFFVFMFNVVFYTTILSFLVNRKHVGLASWSILLPSKNSIVLNIVRLFIYSIFIYVLVDLI